MPTKVCIVCHKIFLKPYNCSLKNWEKIRYCSKECRVKNTTFKKGQIAWNKGIPRIWKSSTEFKKGMKWSDEVRNKLKGRVPWNKGKKMSEKTKEKIRMARSKQINLAKGERHGNWKGGITKLTLRIRNMPEYREWRRQIYERDDFTCKDCGKRGGKLTAEHIIPFCVLLYEGNIKSIEDAKNYLPLWELNNGMTLCQKCQRKTDTYGVNARYLMETIRKEV